jgi:hypothetical protein
MKSYLLLLYSISLFITLKAWYKQGNSGMPDPTVIGPATYLFALLLLSANFLGGLAPILGTSMTFLLYLREHGQTTTPATPSQSSGAHNHSKSQLKLGAK